MYLLSSSARKAIYIGYVTRYMVVSAHKVDSAYQAESDSSLLKNAQEFVNFCQQYISGKERSQAQIFLDRFFQAFGHEGACAGAHRQRSWRRTPVRGGCGIRSCDRQGE